MLKYLKFSGCNGTMPLFFMYGINQSSFSVSVKLPAAV